MSLTKIVARDHRQACALLEKDGPLTLDEKFFVIEHFHEAGDTNYKVLGAHFTPFGLAMDFRYDIDGPRVLDLCAGIGMLSFAYRHCWDHGDTPPDIVCVEANPRYVDVGRKVLPEAEWICGDVFDLDVQAQLKGRHLDTAFGNPPFGKFAMHGEKKPPRYRGGLFEYAVIDIASDLADFGSFIIPQGSSPVLFSGVRCFQDCRRPLPNDPRPAAVVSNMEKYRPFHQATGIDLQLGSGVDTSYFKDEWRGVSPTVEIIKADFLEARHTRSQGPATKSDQLDLQLVE